MIIIKECGKFCKEPKDLKNYEHFKVNNREKEKVNIWDAPDGTEFKDSKGNIYVVEQMSDEVYKREQRRRK